MPGGPERTINGIDHREFTLSPPSPSRAATWPPAKPATATFN
jgi:hypothetical protein